MSLNVLINMVANTRHKMVNKSYTIYMFEVHSFVAGILKSSKSNQLPSGEVEREWTAELAKVIFYPF